MSSWAAAASLEACWGLVKHTACLRGELPTHSQMPDLNKGDFQSPILEVCLDGHGGQIRHREQSGWFGCITGCIEEGGITCVGTVKQGPVEDCAIEIGDGREATVEGREGGRQ
ncbi:hypothetical protein B0H17DRAFT_1134832 [Mycena rosella]|uniref:Uncharacterized protein n=1 Tax=Mycena rosella TaxID=1033263 RepID=A0AAD7DHG9_MYCRO|nr:hypothetical protein B0H17DRAFT_1134832 [Mycena rosella]